MTLCAYIHKVFTKQAANIIKGKVYKCIKYVMKTLKIFKEFISSTKTKFVLEMHQVGKLKMTFSQK